MSTKQEPDFMYMYVRTCELILERLQDVREAAQTGKTLDAWAKLEMLIEVMERLVEANDRAYK